MAVSVPSWSGTVGPVTELIKGATLFTVTEALALAAPASSSATVNEIG
jgi:hypothetical protein